MVARIDAELMRDTGSKLRTVASEFEHANARSDEAADAVGHDGLADRVRGFAHNWDDKRGKMLKQIGLLGEAATGIGDNFLDLDQAFVDGLQGDA